jgi:N-succinyldiaminopimelate aminotransferase
MNPLLTKLQPYPFERLRKLFAGVTPNADYTPISLGIGEPKHPTPAFIRQALTDGLAGLEAYPATAGDLKLRASFTGWLQRRYGSDRPERPGAAGSGLARPVLSNLRRIGAARWG